MTHANGYQQVTNLKNNFKYNGVEHIETIGFDMYSTLFRLYDPTIGRFHQIDPLADFMQGITPYNFGIDNPILFNDPDGLAPAWYGKFRAFLNKIGKRLKGDKTSRGVYTDKKTGITYHTSNHRLKRHRGAAKFGIRNLKIPSPKLDTSLPGGLAQLKDPVYPKPEPEPEPKPKPEPEPKSRRRSIEPGSSFESEFDPFAKYSSEFDDQAKIDEFLQPYVNLLNEYPESFIKVIVGTNSGGKGGKVPGRAITLGEVANKRGGAIRKALKLLGLKNQKQLEIETNFDSKTIKIEVIK